MSGENDLSGSVGLDTTAFKTGVADLKTQVKQIETSFRASAAIMGNWSDTTEGLESRTESLKDKLKLQKQALDILNEQYKNATTNADTNKNAVKNLADQMYSMEKQISNTERDLEKYNEQLRLQQSEWENLHQKMQDVSGPFKAIGDGFTKTGKTMTTALTVPIAGIIGAAINIGNEFESQMSRVSAVSGATGGDLDQLRDQAKQLGSDTAFSASEAAQGMENLGSAGFDTKEIMAAMPGMLDLAASSGSDLASSADIAASMIRGFSIDADQAGHVADVLAKNAAQTNAAVADTGNAMKYIAPVAQNAGWSLESVTAAIGEMADAGIKGEQAGTTLRGVLTNLMNPSSTAADAMSSIGFSAYDAEGKMKPLSQIVGELNEKTAGLSDQQRDQVIATIMGTDALSGMQVLLKDGKDNLDSMTDSLINSDGAAKDMASTMQGNSKGAIEQMKGALESAAITLQETLAPIVTKVANAVQELANKFVALSPAQQEMILNIAAIVAALGPAILIIGKLVSGVGAIAGAIGTLSGAIAVVTTGAAAATPAIAGLAAIISSPLLPILGIIAAIGALVAIFAVLWQNCEGFRNFWIGLWDSIKTAAETVVNALVTFFTVTIPGAWNGLVSFFTSIPAWWSGLWQQIGDFFNNIWNNIITFITQKIPEIINNIIQWFNDLPYKIGYALGQILGNIVKWCTDTFNTVKEQIPIIISNIANWFSELPGKIWNFLVNVVTNIGTWCSDMLNTLTREIPNLISKVATWFSELPGKVWNFLVDVVNNVVQWCGNLVTTASTEIPKFTAEVIKFISELPGNMLDIGGNIVRGIWDGISNMVGWIGQKIKDFCRGILDGFKKALDIHSPSQLFADIVGKNIALGIGQGFSNSISGVVKQMTAAIPTNFDVDINPRAMWQPVQPAYAYSGSMPATAPAISYTSNYYSPAAPTPSEVNRINRQNAQRIALLVRR